MIFYLAPCNMYYAKINEYASRKNADLFDNKYNGPTFYDMVAKTKTYEFLLLTKLSYLLCRAGIVKCKRNGSCCNRFTFSDAIFSDHWQNFASTVPGVDRLVGRFDWLWCNRSVYGDTITKIDHRYFRYRWNCRICCIELESWWVVWLITAR